MLRTAVGLRVYEAALGYGRLTPASCSLLPYLTGVALSLSLSLSLSYLTGKLRTLLEARVAARARFVSWIWSGEGTAVLCCVSLKQNPAGRRLFPEIEPARSHRTDQQERRCEAGNLLAR